MIEPRSLSIELNAQQLRRWSRRVFDTFFCTVDPSVAAFGKECVWHIHTGLLQHGCTVVSAGVGNDVSFEKELVAYFGAKVLLLDPSPTGIHTMARHENQVPGIEFMSVGLAGSDGTQSFAAPHNPNEGSFRVDDGESGSGAVPFDCRSLSSLAAEHGLERIDLLKLDIEGFEYDVIDDLLNSGIEVRQLCVEFHHFMEAIPLRRTLRALASLRRAGFRLIHKDGSDYTLVHAPA